MENKHQRREETQEANGVDKSTLNAATTKSARFYNRLSEAGQGYVLIASGVILLLFAFGYFHLLNWVIALGALGLIVYGAAKADIFQKSQKLVTDLRNKYKNKK